MIEIIKLADNFKITNIKSTEKIYKNMTLSERKFQCVIDIGLNVSEENISNLKI